MNPNLVSAAVSPDDLQEINTAIETLKQKLPFLINLSIKDRRFMPKLGDKTEAFVQKAVDIANEHQEMFAPAFMEELRRDKELLDVLSPILFALKTFTQRVDDTTMQVGAEVYAAARTIYSVTKTPFARAPMQMAGEDLGKRYGRKKRADPATADEPASSSTTEA